MQDKDLMNKDYFPRWLHALTPKGSKVPLALSGCYDCFERHPVIGRNPERSIKVGHAGQLSRSVALNSKMRREVHGTAPSMPSPRQTRARPNPCWTVWMRLIRRLMPRSRYPHHTSKKC